jgi:tetratricopeptide (TPR) repeat protein
MFRGKALQAQDKFAAAFDDYGQATDLMKEIKRQYEESHQIFPSEWQHDLANTYMNRGNALHAQDKFAAFDDYGLAIDLIKEIKRQYEESHQIFPSKWQQNLANTYINRGNMFARQGNLAVGFTDYSYGIGLSEELLSDRGYFSVIPDLASAYCCLVEISNSLRGTAADFLNRLSKMRVSEIPAHWKDKIDNLANLLETAAEGE